MPRHGFDDQLPNAAGVDLNLGQGPSFTLAEALDDGRVPSVFTISYDPEIRRAFEDLARLHKPVPLRHDIAAVARLVSKGE